MPLGLLGRTVLDALVVGERDPTALRSVGGTVAKARWDSIRVALTGCLCGMTMPWPRPRLRSTHM